MLKEIEFSGKKKKDIEKMLLLNWRFYSFNFLLLSFKYVVFELYFVYVIFIYCLLLYMLFAALYISYYLRTPSVIFVFFSSQKSYNVYTNN